ncbi:uncharacterized protein LOC119102327 [Pollicipes pollicipes]|uniref:uncharacterized protein LOC119102327 n=1 Tax=Pollicipes pollicipes TaxID=41117 RepID=UPI0018856B74|nr:uncharacterized protein LOC119102327 [Pollicipes pollicipes]
MRTFLRRPPEPTRPVGPTTPEGDDTGERAPPECRADPPPPPAKTGFSTWSRLVGHRWHQLRRADSQNQLADAFALTAPRKKKASTAASAAGAAPQRTAAAGGERVKLDRVESLKNLFLRSREPKPARAGGGRNLLRCRSTSLLSTYVPAEDPSEGVDLRGAPAAALSCDNISLLAAGRDSGILNEHSDGSSTHDSESGSLASQRTDSGASCEGGGRRERRAHGECATRRGPVWESREEEEQARTTPPSSSSRLN